jgi:O-acetyl-ADP-ribose deacetylase (regulator of RNase III)
MMRSQTHIHIVQGDITRAATDAIVNAANPEMLGGGGVDGAIHAAAGPQLRRACEQVKPVDGMRCPPGEARITPGFDLSARWVIHTVGPRYGYDRNPDQLLRAAYNASLQLAVEHRCTSIAFPAISCGAYGFPPAEAAEIALDVCSDGTWQELAIYFYLFSEELVTIWQQTLARTQNS